MFLRIFFTEVGIYQCESLYAESLEGKRYVRSAFLNCVRGLWTNGTSALLPPCSAGLASGISLVKASPSRFWLLTDWKAVGLGRPRTPGQLGSVRRWSLLKWPSDWKKFQVPGWSTDQDITEKPGQFRIEHPVTSYMPKMQGWTAFSHTLHKTPTLIWKQLTDVVQAFFWSIG